MEPDFFAPLVYRYDQPDMPLLLAKTFAKELRGELTESEMRIVIKRNKTPKYSGGACASHDFCDANMTMLAAWQRLYPHAICVHGDDEAQVALWNAAWGLAARGEFWAVV